MVHKCTIYYEGLVQARPNYLFTLRRINECFYDQLTNSTIVTHCNFSGEQYGYELRALSLQLTIMSLLHMYILSQKSQLLLPFYYVIKHYTKALL